MQYKHKLFYQKKQEVNFDFTSEDIGSDGAVILSKKIEIQNKIIKGFTSILVDGRNKSYTDHSLEKLICQRVFLLIQGYCDCNDSKYLAFDPIFQTALGGQLASQPTLSRFENTITIRDLWRLSEYMIDRYIDTIDKDRKEIIIDADGTDDQTHGKQQLSFFNGYYGQHMYHLLLFHDGQTGQVILPVLRPGNCHSNKWFVSILKRIVERIQNKRPELKITLRGDCGFSCAEVYSLADLKGLKFCFGISANSRLKKSTALLEAIINKEYLSNKEKHQEFIEGFSYKADSWENPQNCYAKVESTGKGMNIRYFCSNMESDTAKTLYQDFYVKRGDSSENRIKELKNMCFADRLSCHKFTANYFRLFLSTLCYEFYRQIKLLINKSSHQEAKKWQIDNIRLFLMKVGATIEKKVKTITIRFSKSYVCRELFIELVQLC